MLLPFLLFFSSKLCVTAGLVVDKFKTCFMSNADLAKQAEID